MSLSMSMPRIPDPDPCYHSSFPAKHKQARHTSILKTPFACNPLAHPNVLLAHNHMQECRLLKETRTDRSIYQENARSDEFTGKGISDNTVKYF